MFGQINRALSNLWAYRIRKPFNKYVGYLFAVMSTIMLFSELGIFTGIPLNLISVLLDLDLGYYGS
jgi:hypothetical protein